MKLVFCRGEELASVDIPYTSSAISEGQTISGSFQLDVDHTDSTTASSIWLSHNADSVTVESVTVAQPQVGDDVSFSLTPQGMVMCVCVCVLFDLAFKQLHDRGCFCMRCGVCVCVCVCYFISLSNNFIWQRLFLHETWCVCVCMLLAFYVAFNNLSVISRRWLLVVWDALCAQVLSTANTDAPCRRHKTRVHHPVTLSGHRVNQSRVYSLNIERLASKTTNTISKPLVWRGIEPLPPACETTAFTTQPPQRSML